jgi:hypothetical protein
VVPGRQGHKRQNRHQSQYRLRLADAETGGTRDFHQIGISANKAGISVYILGLDDKTYLARTYGKKLGKASVTGTCIKFKALKDIGVDVLEAAVRDGVEKTGLE